MSESPSPLYDGMEPEEAVKKAIDTIKKTHRKVLEKIPHTRQTNSHLRETVKKGEMTPEQLKETLFNTTEIISDLLDIVEGAYEQARDLILLYQAERRANRRCKQ